MVTVDNLTQVEKWWWDEFEQLEKTWMGTLEEWQVVLGNLAAKRSDLFQLTIGNKFRIVLHSSKGKLLCEQLTIKVSIISYCIIVDTKTGGTSLTQFLLRATPLSQLTPSRHVIISEWSKQTEIVTCFRLAYSIPRLKMQPRSSRIRAQQNLGEIRLSSQHSTF